MRKVMAISKFDWSCDSNWKLCERPDDGINLAINEFWSIDQVTDEEDRHWYRGQVNKSIGRLPRSHVTEIDLPEASSHHKYFITLADFIQKQSGDLSFKQGEIFDSNSFSPYWFIPNWSILPSSFPPLLICLWYLSKIQSFRHFWILINGILNCRWNYNRSVCNRCQLVARTHRRQQRRNFPHILGVDAEHIPHSRNSILNIQILRTVLFF